MKQENLELPLSHEYHESDWLVMEENNAATELINNWPNWQHHAVIIIGDSGVGKTHLANIWAEKSRALFLGERDDIPSGKVFIVDDMDSWRDEAKILHLYNYAKEREGFILLTTKELTTKWVRLPDLQSRLNATPQINLKAPGDEMLYLLLHKAFIARQLRVKNDVVEYAVKRIERSAHAVNDLVERLDVESLSHKRAITIPLVKQILS